MATTVSSGPRYAPEDPTLPKPWKGLVDGKTGYLYFWNPETNITQYERPGSAPPSAAPSSAPPKSVQMIASIHVQPYQGQQRGGNSGKEENARYNGDNNNGGPKLAAIPGGRNNQSGRDVPNGSVNIGHGGSSMFDDGTSVQALKSSAKARGSDPGNNLSLESYLRHHEITVSGDNVPPPFMSFESTGFPPEILREVQGAGFSAPTPIQAQSWPIALQSRDIVAVAKTGSGKTLGYLIPSFILLKRCRNNSQMGPTVLVLSPTRELATQIQDEAIKFGRSSRISCTCLYGGAPKGPQLREIERGADVVVATPGRLNDILEMKKISLRQVSYLVLDEADRMLDMGFEPQIRKIVNEIPPRRQTLMYTATWPKEVRKIAADLLVNPVQVNIGNIDELVANKSITQYVEVVQSMEKQRRLEQIIRSQEPGSKIIIFCSTKKMCDMLARNITRNFGAAAIHGDKSQGERDYVLNQFRSGKSPVLVATDVAARGLDVKDIRVVVNYDFPTGIEDYVHRIGRTGRAGATGEAYTFFGEQDAKYASDLIKVLEGADQRVPPQIRDLASRGGGMGRPKRPWGSSSGGGYGGRGSNESSYGGYGGKGSNESSYGGYGGRGSNESSYGGRGGSESSYGGRGGRGPPSSGRSDRDFGGRGYDREPRDRYDRKSPDGLDNPPRGSFHNSMFSGGGDKDRVRSRSRSPNRGNGWGPVRKSRSRSPDRLRGNQPPVRRDASPPKQQWVRSPRGGEEDEEGMIQPEEGMISGNGDGEHPVLID